jgi:hypothetical protein
MGVGKTNSIPMLERIAICMSGLGERPNGVARTGYAEQVIE